MSVVSKINRVLGPLRRIRTFLAKFLRFGGLVPNLTFAGKVAWTLLICMFLGVTAGLIYYIASNATHDGLFKTTWWLNFLLVYYPGSILASVFVYWGIRNLTFELPSLYPEIDRCWDAMEVWRESKMLEHSDFKRFLVVGPDFNLAQNIHKAVRDHKSGPLPAGPNEWMHWFGNKNQMFLHLAQICHLNIKLETLLGGKGKRKRLPRGTIEAGEFTGWSMQAGDDGYEDEDMRTAALEVDDIGVGGGTLEAGGGTMGPSDDIPYEEEFEEDDLHTAATSDSEQDEFDDLDDTPLDRIEYLCKHFLKKTEGEFPFSGILIAIPFNIFLKDGPEYKVISKAIYEDLRSIFDYAGVVVPVTFIFCSMEQDEGFPKLQSLLGNRPLESRFGSGCKTVESPTISSANMDVFVSKTCQFFWDCVLRCWNRPELLSQANKNKELFKMLSRVHRDFRPKFSFMLDETLLTLSRDDGVEPAFAGCYFASTGKNKGDQGFITSALDKAVEFEELSSWNGDLVSRNELFDFWASALFGLTVLIVFIFSVYFLITLLY